MLETLPADSFAAMVYWIFISGLAMTIIALLEKAYQLSKTWFFTLIILPPLNIIFIYRNWLECRSICVFFSGFYTIILIAGALSGYPMAPITTHTLTQVILWPYYLAKSLLANYNDSLAVILHSIIAQLHYTIARLKDIIAQ